MDHAAPLTRLDLAEYAHALIRRWPYVVGLTVLGLLLGLAAGGVAPRQYTATTEVAIAPLSADVVSGQRADSDLVDSATELAVIGSYTVAELATLTLDDGTAPADLRERAAARSVGDGTVAEISVTAASRDGAVREADALADAYLVDRAAEAAGRAGHEEAPAAEPVAGRVLTAAADNPVVEGPDRRSAALSGGALGLVAGLAAALALGRVAPRLHSAGEIARGLGAEVLADPRSADEGRAAAAEKVITMLPPAARTLLVVDDTGSVTGASGLAFAAHLSHSVRALATVAVDPATADGSLPKADALTRRRASAPAAVETVSTREALAVAMTTRRADDLTVVVVSVVAAPAILLTALRLCDAAVVVAGEGHASRRGAEAFRREAERSATPVLGVVVERGAKARGITRRADASSLSTPMYQRRRAAENAA